MADYKDSPLGRQDPVYTHDEADGSFSRSVASHLRGWDATDGAWYRIPVDHATGALLTVASGAAGGGLTDTQLRASAVPVSLASLPSLAAGSAVIGHVIVDTAPTTAVTQSTSPWVTNDPGLPDTLGQKAMANSTSVALSSDQASIPVAATLAAETTKVIGTVNQGTSPWVTSRNWTLSSGTDSVSATVSNFPATQAVSNAGTFAVQATATQSGSWVLSGSDNVTTLPVSARTHNGFNHLYVRDAGVIAVLSELLFEMQQLNYAQENN